MPKLKSSSTMKKRPKSTGNRSKGVKAVIDDPRFRAMHASPVFQRAPKDQHKVKLDNRFQAVLTDDRFQVAQSKYDKYGRKTKKQGVESELSSFYKIDGNDKEDGTPEMSEKKAEKAPDDRLEFLNKMARGEIEGSSSSGESSDEISDNEDASDKEEYEDKLVEAREQLAKIDEPVMAEDTSHRLAVQNCDWKHLKAADILVLLQSFCPPQGAVKRVTVYPSDYGLQKMAEEIKFGPQDIWKDEKAKPTTNEEKGTSDKSEDSDDDSAVANDKDSDSEDIDSEASADEAEMEELLGLKSGAQAKAGDYDQEALRNYELQTLKYYFAVAEFDTKESAVKVYEQVDGMEFENSSSTFDLRFIPDDINFEGREIRDLSSGIMESGYQPPSFITKALQQTKVESTWDEGDHDRSLKLTNFSKWREMNDDDLAVYLASSESEDEDSDQENSEEKAKKLRQMLLGEGNDDDVEDLQDAENETEPKEEEEEGDMEMTFIPELDTAWKKGKKDKGGSDDEKKGDEQATPWEQYLKKRKQKVKEKKKKRKEKATEEAGHEEDLEDDFFMQSGEKEKETLGSKSNKQKDRNIGKKEEADKQTDADLELLLMGNEGEGIDDARDFDMRALVRKEKMKGKKLRGKRKRKEEKKGAAKGADFKVNVGDERFAAVMEGDSRFGIDRTDAAYKETEGMQQILKEQKRRKKKKKKGGKTGPQISDKSTSLQTEGSQTSGDPGLKLLVNKLKRK